MKLIDEIYELYRDRLTGDEEDLDVITYSILEDNDREDMLSLVNEMSNDDLHSFLSYFILEKLRLKFSRQNDFALDSKYLQ